MAFRDGENFCKAFAEALMHRSYPSWLRLCTCASAKTMQKLYPSRTVMTQWGQDSFAFDFTTATSYS